MYSANFILYFYNLKNSSVDMENLVKSIWKVTKYYYKMFGYNLTDFSESYKKKSNLEKGYSLILFIILIIVIIFDMKYELRKSTHSILYYLYALVLMLEGLFCLTAMIIAMHDNQAEKIFRNIQNIDEKLELKNENFKSEFKQGIIFVYPVYITYFIFKDTFDYIVWNFSFAQVFWSWRMKFGDLIMLKFITEVHLHLNRFNIFNNHLMKNLKPLHVDCQRSDWLTSWRLYQKNDNYNKNSENISIYTLLKIYKKISENVDILSKNMKFMVSRVSNIDFIFRLSREIKIINNIYYF